MHIQGFHHSFTSLIVGFAVVTVTARATADEAEPAIVNAPAASSSLPSLPPLPTTRVHAAQGGRVEVQTPTGTVEVQCPPAATPAPMVASPAARATITKDESYGASVFISDALAAGLLIGGASESSSTVAGLGFLLYALGGPVVHAANGEPGRAFASLGLRAGVPIAGAMLGYGLGRGTCNSSSSCFGAAILGGLGLFGGAVAASVIDGAVLAKRQVTEEVQAARITPHVAIDSTGAQGGVAGTF
jgi:hypothetical protein